MGPIIYKRKGKDNIDYNLRAIPIGGFVSMAGEVYEDNSDISKDKFMCNKPWLHRIIILVAGVVNNFLLAIILLFIGALIGVPDSGLDAALGYSQASGIPYGIGLIKNKYIGRTFISPGQDSRIDQVKIKLSAVEESVRGKRVVMIDDSIVRGTTCGRILKLLRDAGAKEIHVRISAPPFLHPCYYGTDIDSEEHLIACHYSEEEICRMIGADSLGYLPIESLRELVKNDFYCNACFSGTYPTEIPKDIGKNKFEQRLSEKYKNNEEGRGSKDEAL